MMMKQTITTKFLGPTGTKGSRIKAYCQAKTLIVSFAERDFELSIDDSHIATATQLANDMGWLDDGTVLVSGFDAQGLGCHVLVHPGELPAS